MNDLISRQAAVDALKDAGMANYLATGDFYGIINALTVIKNMPTAEPKKGKWIINSPVTMKCDQCGYSIPDWKVHEARFCHNCGARMTEESDG